MNGEETGIDCGGPDCPVCPSCEDGIQNGDETGVDCGGSCTLCACEEGENFILNLVPDEYPEEVTWEITQEDVVVASGGGYGVQHIGASIEEVICLAEGCYEFAIYDAYGDGICCSAGFGSYILGTEEDFIFSGGNYTISETTEFCVGDQPTHIQSSKSNIELSVFPNPTTTSVWIQWEGKMEAKSMSIDILNYTGQIMKSIPLDNAQGRQSISLEGLASGVYFIDLKAEGRRVASRRVVKL